MIPDSLYHMFGMLPRREVEKRIRRHLAPRFSASGTEIYKDQFHSHEATLGRVYSVLVSMPDVKRCHNKSGDGFIQWRLTHNP
jgi:hypothetical protein